MGKEQEMRCLSLSLPSSSFFLVRQEGKKRHSSKGRGAKEEKKLCLPPPHLSTYPLSPSCFLQARSGQRAQEADVLAHMIIWAGPKRPGAQTAVFRRRWRWRKIVNLSDDDEDSLSISLPKQLLVSDVTTTTSTYVIIAFPLSLSLCIMERSQSGLFGLSPLALLPIWHKKEGGRAK